ncbi:hypothetical protein DFH07DRAFT_728449 [Mycena maculata]|uniref:C2H2-type domain-containing protein n=1 Tax=Mycena maculata TaxID=230809 RepID=A0AAD7KCB2_9AGAR|nr:hypothetical protein DFH07DRAFT_728449 [Mycena maculata]
MDAAAEEIAARLHTELWAEISKVKAAEPAVAPAPTQIPSNAKEQAAVSTVRAILASLQHDALAKSTLGASKMAEFAGGSLLDILRNIADSGKIPKGAAMPISRFLVTLARSDFLFGSLRHSDASSLQLKRKREEVDSNERAGKRAHTENHPLYMEVAQAVRVISQTITSSQTISPPLITSIQLQLQRVFLFAVSSSGAGGPNANALQEISGLIQVLGVLSGIQIGQAPSAESQNSLTLTAVHPCLVAGCGKFFARLYSLRAHQRVHNGEQPLQSWKCDGCDKVFARRDAIKRHQSTTEARQPSAACAKGQIIEMKPPSGTSDPAAPDGPEDGEIEAAVISGIQATVMELHAPLQAHVSRALGAPSGQAQGTSSDPTNGQATLASVIARAQAAQAGRTTNEAPAMNTVVPADSSAPALAPPTSAASLSTYGLSDEQTKLLEEAIINAASAAQAEAEAQAALEEQSESNEEDEDRGNGIPSAKPPPPA